VLLLQSPEVPETLLPCHGGGRGHTACQQQPSDDRRASRLQEVDARPFLVKFRDGFARLFAPYI